MSPFYLVKIEKAKIYEPHMWNACYFAHWDPQAICPRPSMIMKTVFLHTWEESKTENRKPVFLKVPLPCPSSLLWLSAPLPGMSLIYSWGAQPGTRSTDTTTNGNRWIQQLNPVGGFSLIYFFPSLEVLLEIQGSKREDQLRTVERWNAKIVSV